MGSPFLAEMRLDPTMNQFHITRMGYGTTMRADALNRWEQPMSNTLHLRATRSEPMSSNGKQRGEPMSKPLVDPKKPNIPLGQVFERVNRDGRRYLTGSFGGGGVAELLIINTGKESRGEPVWQVYLGEAFHLEQAAALARDIEEEGSAR